MRTEARLTSPAVTAGDVTVAEWRDFQNVCSAEIDLGGERGAVAARMLDIGDRLQALSRKVDAAVERYCSK